MEEHDHVRQCAMSHHYGDNKVGAIFFSLQEWETGRARILNAKLRDHIDGLPVDGQLADGRFLKEKLIATLKKAAAPMPRSSALRDDDDVVAPWHRAAEPW